MRKLLKAKIHRATVTGADLDYQGSVSIDKDLLTAAGLMESEAVQVWNVSNGNRLETYVITAPAGSGEICLNGAAARLFQAGDLAIIASFCWVEEAEALIHKPTILLVDGNNRITKRL